MREEPRTITCALSAASSLIRLRFRGSRVSFDVNQDFFRCKIAKVARTTPANVNQVKA
jgi:hypothetical protein